MLNIKSKFANRSVLVNLPSGLYMWNSTNSGELKSYIAETVFLGVFRSEVYSVDISYFYVSYKNGDMLKDILKKVKGLGNKFFLIIDNAEILVSPFVKNIIEVGKLGTVVLIGRNYFNMGLKEEDISGFVSHVFSDNSISVEALPL